MSMDIHCMLKEHKEELKGSRYSIRTTKYISDWLDDNNVSPTKLFNEAAKELIEQEENKDV